MDSSKQNKRVIFISHAASDGAFADTVKREITRVLTQSVDVFCTSSPRAIVAGEDWLATIEAG